MYRFTVGRNKKHTTRKSMLEYEQCTKEKNVYSISCRWDASCATVCGLQLGHQPCCKIGKGKSWKYCICLESCQGRDLSQPILIAVMEVQVDSLGDYIPTLNAKDVGPYRLRKM